MYFNSGWMGEPTELPRLMLKLSLVFLYILKKISGKSDVIFPSIKQSDDKTNLKRSITKCTFSGKRNQTQAPLCYLLKWTALNINSFVCMVWDLELVNQADFISLFLQKCSPTLVGFILWFALRGRQWLKQLQYEHTTQGVLLRKYQRQELTRVCTSLNFFSVK